jgi:predicted CopG family antitoxin
MITTIQIRDNVKAELDRLKNPKNKTYEDVILYLVQMREKIKRKQEELLIEGCKEMAEDSLRICKEWEATDASLDWEW